MPGAELRWRPALLCRRQFRFWPDSDEHNHHRKDQLIEVKPACGSTEANGRI
jgi:hypothetical protein